MTEISFHTALSYSLPKLFLLLKLALSALHHLESFITYSKR